MTISADDLQNSINWPVFLYEITVSDGSVTTPSYKPFTLGRFTLGTLPYRSATSGETTIYLSDGDYTEPQTTPPDKTLDFTASMPGGLTFARSGTAWGWNSSGVFQSYGNNVPRVAMTDENGVLRGLLIEGQRTNLVNHSAADGAVVGVVGGAGSLPSNWWGEWDAGLLWTVVGSGADRGMPYVDINFSGLGATSSPVILQLVGFDSVSATAGDVLTGSVFVKHVGGTLDNVNGFNCRVSGFNTVSRLQTEDSESSFSVSADRFSRGKHTRQLNSVSTDSATVELTMDITLGVPIDITLRISLPQLEAGKFASSPIVTSGAAVTRNADSCYLATSTWWSSTLDMVAAECSFDSLTSDVTTPARTIFGLNNNASGSVELMVDTVFGNINKVVCYTGSVQVVNIGGDVFIEGTTVKTANRFKANAHRHRTSTGSASFNNTTAAISNVNELSIGAWNRVAEPLYGYITRLLLWKNVDNSGMVDSLPYGKLPPTWAAASSTRKNVHYEGRCDNLTMDRTLPLTPESSNKAVLSVGELHINNTDGYFDAQVNQYAVDGRVINVYLLVNRYLSFSSGSNIFNGVGVSWHSEKDITILKVREKSFFLDVPLLTLFGGTGGADGTTANIGHVIPQVYGLCRNITAELVDPAKLIYRFHDRAASDVLAVYDRGAPITKANSYGSYAALSAAATAGGTFDYALTSGGSFYRLGSSPSGSVTADVRGDASSGYASTVAGIIKLLMLRGAQLTDIDTTSLTALDSLVSGEVGCYFNSQLSIATAIDQLCAGTFCFWGDIGNGLLGTYQLVDPTPMTAVMEFNEYAITDEVTPMDLPESIGPTVWRRRVGYQLNWTQLSGTDIVPAPTITEARRKQLQDAFSTVSVGDSSRLNKNLLAVDAPVLVSLFDSSSDATTLANLILALYKPGRRLISVRVGVVGYQLKLLDVVKIKWPRFGLDSGVNMLVVGISYGSDNVQLTLFG